MNEDKKSLAVSNLCISDQADTKGLAEGMKKAKAAVELIPEPIQLTRKQSMTMVAGYKTLHELQKQIEAEKKALKAGKKIKTRKIDWQALIRLRRAEAIVRGQE
jgi:hypothetical protein